ncbi:hypothetical protein MKX03_014625 [Papaver bracteatum]|nr:hypothetical protein MKX03_014625 [Papaver bracteatum]
MSTNENEVANATCSICFEDLKPLSDYIESISTCGHVFHGLCLRTWLENCIARDITCPVCKQTYCPENITRLYYQSIDDAIRSQKLPEKGAQEDNQRLKRKRLEGKVLSLTSLNDHLKRKIKDMGDEIIELQSTIVELTSSSEHQKRKMKDMGDEIIELESKIVGLTSSSEHQKIKMKDMGDEIIELDSKLLDRNYALAQQQQKFYRKTEELVKAESTCSSLRKKLAAAKSLVKSMDSILNEEDGNPASLGKVDNSEDTVGIRKNLPRNCKHPQTPKACSGGQLKARRSFTKRTYEKALEERFQDNKGKYSEMIELKKQIGEAKSRVEDLLEGDQELISGFLTYL